LVCPWDKRRLQVGADADITVFDPDTVIDTATFASGPRYSMGIQHVIGNGVFVVEDGV
jgi:dihydroorotase-like cyclic amidohydrolase